MLSYNVSKETQNPVALLGHNEDNSKDTVKTSYFAFANVVGIMSPWILPIFKSKLSMLLFDRLLRLCRLLVQFAWLGQALFGHCFPCLLGFQGLFMGFQGLFMGFSLQWRLHLKQIRLLSFAQYPMQTLKGKILSTFFSLCISFRIALGYILIPGSPLKLGKLNKDKQDCTIFWARAFVL